MKKSGKRVIFIAAMAGVVAFGLGSASIAVPDQAAAAESANRIVRTDSAGSFPGLSRWEAYSASANLLAEVPTKIPRGQLTLSWKLPGTISSIAAYPGWIVQRTGANGFSLTNDEALVVDPAGLPFVAADVRGSFERGGDWELSVNRGGVKLVSETAPLIL